MKLPIKSISSLFPERTCFDADLSRQKVSRAAATLNDRLMCLYSKAHDFLAGADGDESEIAVPFEPLSDPALPPFDASDISNFRRRADEYNAQNRITVIYPTDTQIDRMNAQKAAAQWN